MVHALNALKEAWRVLVPGGLLCDVHPHAPQHRVELEHQGHFTPVGLLDNIDFPYAEQAAEVLEQIVNEGWFVREAHDQYESLSYWDTVEELVKYYEESTSLNEVSAALAQQISTALKHAPEGTRVCLRKIYHICRLRRLPRD